MNKNFRSFNIKDCRLLISECLLGVCCNYKGTSATIKDKKVLLFINWLIDSGVFLVPVCPEQLGGLSTPRLPSEIIPNENNLKVISEKNDDVTANFEKGAFESLKLAKLFKVNAAILKALSPSCGIGTIYDGTFKKVRVPGDGVAAKLLLEHGYRVFDENNIGILIEKYETFDEVLKKLIF